MKTQTTNQLNELPAYYIEKVTNNGITYFQEIRRRDGAIIYSNISLRRVAERTFCPTYKDGTRVLI